MKDRLWQLYRPEPVDGGAWPGGEGTFEIVNGLKHKRGESGRSSASALPKKLTLGHPSVISKAYSALRAQTSNGRLALARQGLARASQLNV
jgi:hypothetical protein